MGRLFLIIAICASIVLCDTVIANTAVPALALKEVPYFLADIRYEISTDYTNVVIGTNKKVEFIYYTLENPYRIIIDLIGVVFCELEQKIEVADGPVKSINIVEDKTMPKPQGLDRYFYAVDYILVELKEKYPFYTFSSKDGKIIIAQIKAQTHPKALIPAQEKAAEEVYISETLEEIPKKPVIPAVIEGVEYQVDPESSTITISSSKNLKTAVYEQYNPYQIVVVPSEDVFCELEEKMEPIDGLVKSISITKDVSQAEYEAPGEGFYPVKNIVIEPIIQLPFTVNIADDGRIATVQIKKTQMLKVAEEEIVKEPEEEKEAKTPQIEIPPAETMVVEALTPDEKGRLVEELTQRLYKKQEELFLKKEQEEQRKKIIREARDKAKAIRAIEKIGIEELEDLMVKGEGVATLKSCQDTALSYSEPAAIAEEEIKLSELKLKENFRALFPNVKLKASETSGGVLGTDFIEKLYGIEAEHPLYQGGKLRNAYQQSKVNFQLAKAKYNKVVHDLKHKVAEAYYSTVTSVMNLKLQQGLLKSVEEILKMAQKRRASGLSTDLEIFNVKSQYNQVQFQLASAERDLALARAKLKQAMGLDIAKEETDVGEVDTELKFEIVEVNLDKCLEMAQEYHPDIIVNELQVQSNEYEEKIQGAKDKFKVDLTGFFGRSGSHYVTEPEKSYKDWNVGIKVSKPFKGNTATYSFTKEETKRKIGLTDRQSTTVHSGEFAILDAMGVASDIKEAKIKRHRAENELLEARRQVNMEAKEAYYNYQEAIIQVKNSLEKVRYQKEALKTAKAQAELNEALQSQVFEAEVKLTDERSLYIKALSDYNFSLAKLNKAIGIEDYFKI